MPMFATSEYTAIASIEVVALKMQKKQGCIFYLPLTVESCLYQQLPSHPAINNILFHLMKSDGRRLRRFPLNVRAVSAKIKLPKKYLQHCHILRTDKKNLSLLLLPS